MDDFFKAMNVVGLRPVVIDENSQAYKTHCPQCGTQYDWYGNTAEPQITCDCGLTFWAKGKVAK